jgi:hypothetical protein
VADGTHKKEAGTCVPAYSAAHQQRVIICLR